MVNDKTKDIITCKLGKACVPSMVASGYAFMVLSLFPFYTLQTSGFIAAALFFILGLFFVFTTAEITLDIQNKKINHYFKYFGFIKINNWVDVSSYTLITVLKANKVYTTYSRTNRASSQERKTYEVYLMDNTKTKRQLTSIFLHANQAVTFAKEIAERLGIKYIVYYRESGWDT